MLRIFSLVALKADPYQVQFVMLLRLFEVTGKASEVPKVVNEDGVKSRTVSSEVKGVI